MPFISTINSISFVSSSSYEQPKNLRGVIMALAPDSKDFDPEDVDMSTYEDRFERQQQQQQLEQNDGTKSLHQKSGAGCTDSVARDGTRDTSSKPQSTENWCKQYAAEPRCQANNYCTTKNLCTNTTRVEPSSTRGHQHLRPWVPSGITRVEPSNTVKVLVTAVVVPSNSITSLTSHPVLVKNIPILHNMVIADNYFLTYLLKRFSQINILQTN